MTEFGFMEAFTYSMIDRRLEKMFQPSGKPILLLNPISPEMSMMRPSLLPGILHTSLYNYNRGVESLRTFELGSTFYRKDNRHGRIREKSSLAAAVYGQRVPPTWDHLDTPSDLFTIKGILESLFRKISLDKIEFISYDLPYLEKCSAINLDRKTIGSFGLYRNSSLLVDFPEPIFLFEIDTDPIIEHFQSNIYFERYSKFPPVKRDLAFVIPDAISVQNVMEHIKNTGDPLLKYIVVDDVYRGPQIEIESRSVKFSLKFFAGDRNLNDDEVDEVIGNILSSVRRTFNIDIRH